MTTPDPMPTSPLGRSPLLALLPEAIRRLRGQRVRRTAPGRPQLDDFVTMTREVVTEHDGEAACVDGAIPPGLDVRYFAGGWYAPTTPPIAHLLDAYSTLVAWTLRDGRRVGGRRSFWPGFVPVHAFGFSASHDVLPDNPLRPPGLAYLLGLGRGVLEAMRETTSRALQLHLIPRDGGPALTVALPQRGFIYHLLNCHDDGELTRVDAFVSNLDPRAESSQFELDPRFPVETHLGGVFRFAGHRSTGAVTSRLLVTGVQRVTFDAVDERHRGCAYRRAWFVSNDQHEGGRSDVVAADVTTGEARRWTTRERVFLRQPRLVPARADAPEGEGWLLVPAYTPHDTRLMIFDAARVEDGPVAVVSAGLRLPDTNHGCVA